MTTTNLYDLVFASLPVKEVHPLHQSVLEECCETVLANDNASLEPSTLVLAVQTAFIICEKTLKSTLNASLKMSDANQITLNYRGQTFIIPANSNLLK